MIRITTTLAAFLSLTAPSLAADPQIVINATDPATTHARLVTAAEKVCAEARAHDPFGDFGQQEECVASTVQGAQVRHVATPILAASRSVR